MGRMLPRKAVYSYLRISCRHETEFVVHLKLSSGVWMAEGQERKEGQLGGDCHSAGAYIGDLGW